MVRRTRRRAIVTRDLHERKRRQNLDRPVSRSEPQIPTCYRRSTAWYAGYLVIAEGEIGNINKLNFLVDTRACPSVVDQKIAHDVKLAEQPERVYLWSKSVQARQVVIPSLTLGPVRIESIPVLAEDLSFLQKALGFKVHAIVGLDVLRKSSFTINYKTKEILFGPPESLTYSVRLRPTLPSSLFEWDSMIDGYAWWWIRVVRI